MIANGWFDVGPTPVANKLCIVKQMSRQANVCPTWLKSTSYISFIN